MGILSQVKSFFTEGSVRPAYGQGEFGGLFSIPFGDGFQRNLDMSGVNARHVPAVYACVMAFARAVSQCEPSHNVKTSDGETESSSTSPASRLLRYPNAYQTINQFLFNVVAMMKFEGECVVLIVRDNRQAPVALHICQKGTAMPYVEPVSGEIFYSVSANPMIYTDGGYMVPARDVIHFREHTPRHPLIGESPIKAAALALGINVALNQHQAAFFQNMSRPSGVLTTDASLTIEQINRLRENFEKHSKRWDSGGMPVLSNGLKFEQLSINSVDAQLVESQRMSVEEIARVFGMPPPLIGDLKNATLSNTEQLISMWLSMSLGALLENIESSFERAFDLAPNEEIELNEMALLRTDFAGRIDGLTKGITGGLYTPNEARDLEGLRPVSDGDTPFLQQQMVPISLLSDMAKSTIGSKVAPQPAKPAPVEPLTQGGTTDPAAADKSFDGEVAKSLIVYSLLQRKKVIQ
jgi:HK97 family phage portal protein